MKILKSSSTAILLLLPGMVDSLQLGNLFGFKPKSAPAIIPIPNLDKTQLLESISFTNNGKSATPETQLKVLNLVRRLETKSPPSPNLLSDPKEAQALSGLWYLQYTSPSDPSLIDAEVNDIDAWKPQNAEEKIATQQINNRGSISAAGINVDTSNRATKQSIDVVNKVVVNEVDLDFGHVYVSGTFRQSAKVPNRAVVSFDTADITLNNGPTLKLGFLFKLIGLVRGTAENGWLETTYVDDSMRIGRGNKGTMFVLTRDRGAVKP